MTDYALAAPIATGTSTLAGQFYTKPVARPSVDAVSTQKREIPIRVSGTELPQWLPAVVKQLWKLRNLPDNWDSYGAKAIPRSTAVNALVILVGILGPKSTPPALIPVRGGSVLLEWHTQDADLELQVSSSGRVQVYFERFGDAAAPYVHDAIAAELMPRLRGFVGQL